MSARAWRTVDHPRHPAKTPGGRGGEFRDKGGGWLGALSGQIENLRLLRSDGTLLPPGMAPPDFDLIDQDLFALYVDALRNGPGWDVDTLRRRMVYSSADPDYAAVIANQQALLVSLELNLEHYRELVAPRMGIENFKKLLTRKIKQAFAGKHVAMRVHPGRLARALARGRFTTVHETNSSSGLPDPDYRADFEERVFGIPPDSPWQDRPIYGYLTGGPEDEVGGLVQYGKIKLVLKDETRQRTTAMFGDSLGNDAAVPTPMLNPDWRSWEGEAYNYVDAADARKRYGPDRERSSKTYIEAQIHGGVTVGDIAEVVFPAEPSTDPEGLQDLANKLTQAGIPWTVDDTLVPSWAQF